MQIGRRIYYDLATGNVILERESRNGEVVDTTAEEDFIAYKSLAERVPATVGFIQLAYGEYDQDFQDKNGIRVDVSGETPSLLFSYPDPNAPELPPVFRKPLSEEVAILKERDMLIQADITAIIEILGG